MSSHGAHSLRGRGGLRWRQTELAALFLVALAGSAQSPETWLSRLFLPIHHGGEWALGEARDVQIKEIKINCGGGGSIPWQASSCRDTRELYGYFVPFCDPAGSQKHASSAKGHLNMLLPNAAGGHISRIHSPLPDMLVALLPTFWDH